MPSRFRELCQEQYIEQFVITKWFDDCLIMFPIQEWKNLEKKLSSLPQTDASARYVLRHIFANAVDVSLDRQGRIFLPLGLREKAGIEKDVTVVGLNNYIELWAKAKWESYYQPAARPLEAIAQTLGI